MEKELLNSIAGDESNRDETSDGVFVGCFSSFRSLFWFIEFMMLNEVSVFIKLSGRAGKLGSTEWLETAAIDGSMGALFGEEGMDMDTSLLVSARLLRLDMLITMLLFLNFFFVLFFWLACLSLNHILMSSRSEFRLVASVLSSSSLGE
jgi:hypothetical protein